MRQPQEFGPNTAVLVDVSDPKLPVAESTTALLRAPELEPTSGTGISVR